MKVRKKEKKVVDRKAEKVNTGSELAARIIKKTLNQLSIILKTSKNHNQKKCNAKKTIRQPYTNCQPLTHRKFIKQKN